MADSAITPETLKQMEGLSSEDLTEVIEMAFESGDDALADVANQELLTRKEEKKPAAKPKPAPAKLTTGEVLGGTYGKEGVMSALGAISKPLTEKQSLEQRALSAAETGVPSAALDKSIAALEHKKRAMGLQKEADLATKVYEREALKLENAAKREIKKNEEIAKVLAVKNSRIKDFKILQEKKDAVYEDAKVRFKEKQGQIRQAMIAFQSRNPYKTVFSSSFGIAAAFVGAIRQSLFGGENEAVKYMNDKVDAMIRQNQQEQSILTKELANEEELFRNIIDITGHQMDDIYQQKEMFLDDIENALEIINEKYSVNMNAQQLQLAQQTLMDVRAGLENDMAQSVVQKDIDILKADQDLQKRTKKTAAQESRDLRLDDPTENPPSKEFIEKYDSAITNIAAVNKAFETFVDIVLAESPKEDRDKIWTLWTIKGFGAIMPIFSQMRQILGGEKNANAAYVRAKKEMLQGELEARAFAIAKSEQGGGRITEKDFEKTFKRIAKAFTSPRAFAEQVARVINTNVEILGGLMGAANQRSVYSGDGSLALNAHQKWLLAHSGSPTLLSPFIYDSIRKRYNRTIVNKASRAEGALLTDLELEEINQLYPPISQSTVGQEYLRFTMPEEFDRLGGEDGELYMKKIGLIEGTKSALGTIWDAIVD